jgi:hypothetical protein
MTACQSGRDTSSLGLVKPDHVVASKETGQHGINRAFDGSVDKDDFWEVTGLPVDVDISFTQPVAIRSYSLVCGEVGERMPRSWHLLASSDEGKSWKELDSRVDGTPWTPQGDRSYAVAHPEAYPLYRLRFDAAFDPSNLIRIYEIRAYR